MSSEGKYFNLCYLLSFILVFIVRVFIVRVFQAINDPKPVTTLREDNTHAMTIGHFFSWNTLTLIFCIKLDSVKLIQ